MGEGVLLAGLVFVRFGEFKPGGLQPNRTFVLWFMRVVSASVEIGSLVGLNGPTRSCFFPR